MRTDAPQKWTAVLESFSYENRLFSYWNRIISRQFTFPSRQFTFFVSIFTWDLRSQRAHVIYEETGISLPGLFEPSLLPRLIPPPLIPGGGIRVGRPLHPRLRARLLGVHLHAAPYSPYSHLAPRSPIEPPSRKAQGPRELHCSPSSHIFLASVGGALGAVGVVGATLETIHNST